MHLLYHHRVFKQIHVLIYFYVSTAHPRCRIPNRLKLKENGVEKFTTEICYLEFGDLGSK